MEIKSNYDYLAQDITPIDKEMIYGYGDKMLWEHQKAAVQAATERKKYAFFMEMGTGKTASAITAIRNWSRVAGRRLCGLILCPAGPMVQQWAGQLEDWSPVGKSATPLQGSGARRLKLAKQAKETTKSPIFITNYETLLMKPVFDELLSTGLDFIIADESHRLKNPKAKRTKAAIALSANVPRKLILTGTPILQSPMDLFSQYLFMDEGKSFGKNFYIFLPTFFKDRNAGFKGQPHYFPDYAVRPEKIPEFQRIVAETSIRVEKHECLDLPPLIEKVEPVAMSPEQKKAYKEMADDLITYVGDDAVVASIALVKIMRLQQILSGFAVAETEEGEPTVAVFDKNPRLDRLGEIMEEIGPDHKVIIWTAFRETYGRIKDRLQKLGIESAELYGGMSGKKKLEELDRFRGDKSCRALIANPKAGGTGLDLIEASYSIIYSRSYSLEDDLQSAARNHRGGSEIHDKITRIHLVAEGTMDETIMEALKNKEEIGKLIVNNKQRILEGL